MDQPQLELIPPGVGGTEGTTSPGGEIPSLEMLLEKKTPQFIQGSAELFYREKKNPFGNEIPAFPSPLGDGKSWEWNFLPSRMG